MNYSPAMIADSILAHNYDDLDSRLSLIDIATQLCALQPSNPNPDDATLRLALTDMINLDIADLLHNANLDHLFCPNAIDALTSDEYEQLSDRIFNLDDLAPMIADRLIARSS